MNYIFSFLIGSLTTLILTVMMLHIYIKGYLKGFVDSHKKDLKILKNLPTFVKKIYKVKIDD